MPGGSVNGRPFKESKDSYSRTGIPCGNPKRFHSQDVVRMGMDQSVRSRDLSGPVENIETEGQRQLKTLVEKQLKTNTTVKQQLAQSRKFTHGTLFKPSTDDVEGIVNLSDFRALEETDNRVTELRLCGLTDDEIRLKIGSEGNVEMLSTIIKKPRLGREPSYFQVKLKEIDRKIEEHKKSLEKPDIFSGQTSLGRHAMDLEKSLVQDHGENKQLSNMLLKTRTKETSDAYPHPNDPMNHIPEIFNELNTNSFGKRKNSKRKEMLESESCTNYLMDESSMAVGSESCSEVIGCKTKEESLSCISLSNISVKTHNDISIQEEKQCMKASACSSDVVDKSVDKQKVIKHLVSQVQKSEILTNKLSVEELRKLPKFADYEAGNPNKVLYIKNLPSKVTENELGSLFLRFQKDNEPPLSFRIMTGKMKGQAFVTFNDTETAAKALELLNGYKLSDKPIVIQYGRNK